MLESLSLVVAVVDAKGVKMLFGHYHFIPKGLIEGNPFFWPLGVRTIRFCFYSMAPIIN